MTNLLEKIDELRKRANVSYEDAKDALEKNNEDVLEALIYLEKQNKTNSNSNEFCGSQTCNSFFDKVKKIIKKGNSTMFTIKKAEKTILSLPVTAVVIISIFAFYVVIIGLIIALLTGHRIKFECKNGEDMKVNKTLSKMSDIVDDVINE